MTLSGAQVSVQRRYQLLTQAGFNAGQALVMTALSTLECPSCNFASVNASGDVGMMQINRQHWGSSDPTRSVYGDLTDPAVSARAAFALFTNAGGQSNPVQGYQQWCTYPGGCGGPRNVPNQITAGAFNLLLQQVAAQVQGTPIAEPATGGDTGSGGGSGGFTNTPGAAAQSGGCVFAPTDCSQIKGPTIGPADLTGLAQTACGIQNALGQVGQFFCNLGTIVHWFTVKGHWWQIAFVVAGVVIALIGIGVYLKPDIAGLATTIAKGAA